MGELKVSVSMSSEPAPYTYESPILRERGARRERAKENVRDHRGRAQRTAPRLQTEPAE